MLATLFPKAAHRYLSLPLFGPVMDVFADWLLEQGYTERSRRFELRVVVRMDRYLRRRGIQCIRFRCKTPGRLEALGAFFSGRLGRIETDQMQFAAVEQFPLDGFAGLESDGGSHRDGEVDVETRRSALGSNGLHF